MQETISAVHHAEVEEFFESLGLLEDLRGGKLVCQTCGTVITLANFRAMTKKSGELLLSCNREDCFQRLAVEYAGG